VRAIGWDDRQEEAMLEAIKKEINDAVKEAETKGPPAVETLFDDVTARPTPQLDEQKRRFLEQRKK
jgi:TPP-dependent pyruvate/acetoin dehydrogenase alpha subunit